MIYLSSDVTNLWQSVENICNKMGGLATKSKSLLVAKISWLNNISTGLKSKKAALEKLITRFPI